MAKDENMLTVSWGDVLLFAKFCHLNGVHRVRLSDYMLYMNNKQENTGLWFRFQAFKAMRNHNGMG